VARIPARGILARRRCKVALGALGARAGPCELTDAFACPQPGPIISVRFAAVVLVALAIVAVASRPTIL
jgi:hypothetical protein